MALSRITVDGLAANAVTSAAIANGEIVLADLANNSVGTDQIIAGAITNAKLAPETTGKSIAISIVFGG